jgi:hypothetical protein
MQAPLFPARLRSVEQTDGHYPILGIPVQSVGAPLGQPAAAAFSTIQPANLPTSHKKSVIVRY